MGEGERSRLDAGSCRDSDRKNIEIIYTKIIVRLPFLSSFIKVANTNKQIRLVEPHT